MFSDLLCVGALLLMVFVLVRLLVDASSDQFKTRIMDSDVDIGADVVD